MKPFRWSIHKREQLGRLLDKHALPDISRTDYFATLRTASAKIIAMSEGADLGFIGRTPENFYDYLSGVFADVKDAPDVHLIPFSLRGAWDADGLPSLKPQQFDGLLACFKEIGVDAAGIADRSKSLALVDLVARGGTLRNLILLLRHQAKMQGVDWISVQRKLRIVGIRVRTHNSPNTWRWQQHQDWLDLIPDTPIKNVAVPGAFIWPLANEQPKVTPSFVPERWSGTDDEGRGKISDDQIVALALAAKLYDIGNDRDERLALSREIVKQSTAMRRPEIRDIVARLKGL